ncbi:MAG TPA: TIGR00730 family Rossman fold protein [Gemmataceae bacterium]|nr:TIGR00730 family Rossman fold protein [Gemmataceae bacterium]
MQRLCVFCGSNVGNQPIYADQARRLGEELGARGIDLVYGGGHIGLMGILADAVLKTGGKVIGVIPQSLKDKELAHAGLTELHVVDTMHQRKALMADLSDGFAGLPGAFGTGDELFEILTWAQLGLHAKPIGLLNVAGYFDSLVAWLERAVSDGFLRAAHRRLLLEAADPVHLLGLLQEYHPVRGPEKWIEKEDR